MQGRTHSRGRGLGVGDTNRKTIKNNRIKPMKPILYSLIYFLILNLSLITAFIAGKIIFRKENINLNSNYSIFLSVLLIFYFVSILVFNLFSFNTKYFWSGLILLPFLFMPFIIGRISKYEKINFYMNMQILTLVISFLAGVLMIFGIN